jgi:tetratricopeptide (TPR) repeat protein
VHFEEKEISKRARPEKEMLQVQNLLFQRKFQEAEELLSEHLQGNVHPDMHYLSGVSSYFQGQLVPSIDHLKKALAMDPKHTDAAICLSVLLNDIGRYDEAKRVFEQANQSLLQRDNIDVDRKFALKHLEIADLYFRYRRYDEAIEEYGKAIRLDPSFLEVRIRRAKAYGKKGFLTRSMQELQQLKLEHAEYLPARIQLGLLHYSQGNLLDAELEWEGVLSIDPHHREALAYLKMAGNSRTKKEI